MRDYWQTFWRAQSDPQNYQDARGYDTWAEEYLCLIRQSPVRSVLEFACGDGEFYARLGFDSCAYTGVDLSANMLERFAPSIPMKTCSWTIFARSFPSSRWISSYRAGCCNTCPCRRYQPTFVQCCDQAQSGWSDLHLSVTWDALRWRYYTGAVGGHDHGLVRRVKGSLNAIAEQAGVRPLLGYWHSMLRVSAGWRLRTASMRHFTVRSCTPIDSTSNSSVRPDARRSIFRLPGDLYQQCRYEQQ